MSRPLVVDVFYEPTYKCKERKCPFCYCPAGPSGKPMSDAHFWSFRDALLKLKRDKRIVVRVLQVIGGGEPLEEPKLMDRYANLTAIRHEHLDLVTSGPLPDQVPMLEEICGRYPKLVINLSVNPEDQASHERVVRTLEMKVRQRILLRPRIFPNLPREEMASLLLGLEDVVLAAGYKRELNLEAFIMLAGSYGESFIRQGRGLAIRPTAIVNAGGARNRLRDWTVVVPCACQEIESPYAQINIKANGLMSPCATSYSGQYPCDFDGMVQMLDDRKAVIAEVGNVFAANCGKRVCHTCEICPIYKPLPLS